MNRASNSSAAHSRVLLSDVGPETCVLARVIRYLLQSLEADVSAVTRIRPRSLPSTSCLII